MSGPQPFTARLPNFQFSRVIPKIITNKIQAIADAQVQGAVRVDVSPEDVLALVTSIALTWSVVGLSPVQPAGSPADHDRRRAVLRHVIERSLTIQE